MTDGTRAAPAPAAARKNKTVRDMALSMGLIAVVVLIFVGMYGGFSFSPGRPTSTAPPPSADAVREFADAHRLLPFTPAVPKGIPTDWHANSAAITNPATADPNTVLTVRGGWLTPTGFVTLVASDARPAALLRSEFSDAGPDHGTVLVGRTEWTVTTGIRAEAAWYRVGGGGITYLITGDADAATFHTLAASIAGH
ncbi:MAG: DUF4245 domain-containing protein [Actinomycetota bacterium]|nr:DUF4245 domain-containing protein [Actinomycetota bacterium]